MSIVTKLVSAVAQVMPDRPRDEVMDQHKYLGQPIDRVDGPDKVRGQATFSAEYQLDSLTYAALACSTIASGTITAIDTAAALAVPGVLTILTHQNAPKMEVPPPFGKGNFNGSTSLALLNTDQVAWDGQPVAIVVAETQDQAEYAASLILPTYNVSHAVITMDEVRDTATKPPKIQMDENEVKKGDAEKLLAGAAFRTDHIYETPRHNHNAIEPHATIAVWSGEGKHQKLTLYDSSQFVNGVQASLAKAFGIEDAAVEVISAFVGGGFGGKGALWAQTQLCALAAREAGRPVCLALSRENIFRIVGGRTATEQRVAIGAKKSGHFTAIIHTGLSAQSTTNEFVEQFTFPVRHLYAADSFLINQSVVALNMTPPTFMRAPGESIGTFALESAIDELSYKLDIDPIELRRRNEPATDPANETPFSSRNLLLACQMGADHFGWANRPAAVASQRQGDWLIGQGFAVGTYPMYRFPASGRVRINADGTATGQCAAHEMGMGTATVQAQHLAERLALPLENVRFQYGDTSLPAGMVAGGSCQTVSIALAIELAFEKLTKDLLSLIPKDTPLHGARPDEIHARNGGLYRKDNPSIGESYTTILERAGKDFLEAEASTGQPLEIMKHSMHSYSAIFAEVRINAVTGELRIQRLLGAFDTGRILNPKTASSQFRGGMIMGIGLALTEETIADPRTGRIVNPSLAEYHVPVQADVPYIDILYTDIPDPLTPLGAHGVGEIGITGVAAAIANATYHATGKRIRSLPITLDKLM